MHSVHCSTCLFDRSKQPSVPRGLPMLRDKETFRQICITGNYFANKIESERTKL